jgi:hypothetical protein
MKLKIKNSKFKINSNVKFQITKRELCHLSFGFCYSFVIWILLFVIFLSGCDAFVRKFTRKPKKENLPREEMVLVPQVYKSTMTKDQMYQQYFLFWKSWQDELIESLSRSGSGNHKKQLSCIKEAIKNLVQLRLLLNLDMQKKLDLYLNQLNDLQKTIEQDVYGQDSARNRLTAERIKMRILRDFSYRKIKGSLV